MPSPSDCLAVPAMDILLHAKSHYSLGYGTSSPADLVETAAALGYRTVALTDLENLYGQVQFHHLCRLRPLVCRFLLKRLPCLQICLRCWLLLVVLCRDERCGGGDNFLALRHLTSWNRAKRKKRPCSRFFSLTPKFCCSFPGLHHRVVLGRKVLQSGWLACQPIFTWSALHS
jgi:hypothetical protein